MGRADKLAYFLEAEQLAGIFAEWPDEMNVVLCLDEDGGCEILVYHKDEGRGVLRKVSSVLQRPMGQFMVVPETKGYPTRRVLFSEEQKMLNLVAEAYDLPEIAQDYAINFQYAVDQGLDPDTMRPTEGAKPRERPAAPGPKFRHRSGAALANDIKPPRPVRPRIKLSMGGLGKKLKPEAPAEPSMPHGYAPAGSKGREDCSFEHAHLYCQDGHVRLVIAPERVTIRTEPRTISDVGFRDDFARFMLPRAALNGWRSGEAQVIDMPVESFPAALARRYDGQARHAEVTVTSRGVFVAPGALVEGWVPPDARRKPILRRVFTPARVMVLTVLGLGLGAGAYMIRTDGIEPLQFGLDLKIFDEAPAPAALESSVEPEVTRQTGSPLSLIDAMAREEERSEGE
ncbi:hypothetical protein [Pseudooceanicola atlanticus]|uniref:Uncharacterized protein n=1 Tax=Pseudooceanicola atlanticus TaxID=1461694 RepID=A0A0A0EA74_9RHOB|nr:hypothetical protein [Pseudooceanicola atlanticus]KGM46978.1 hypothetical protein ATO9_20865 [Pseudooceanicola atlanticus]